MKSKSNNFLPSLILLICAVLNGCSISETKSKDPAFSVDAASMQKDLSKIISCENINLDGKEVTTNGKANAQFEISITNGQNIPTNEDQMRILGKSIASYIKKALKNKNEYDDYTVLFVVKKTESGVTTKNWKGDTFKSEEL